MYSHQKCRWRLHILSVCCLFAWTFTSAEDSKHLSGYQSSNYNTELTQPLDQATSDFDFGAQGDLILQVYLRDILLTDALFAITRSGSIYLPLAEISDLLDFPIIVDVAQGRASGWYLDPSNTFSLNTATSVVKSGDTRFSFARSGVFSDEIDLYVDSTLLEQWFPLFLDISLSTQVLNIRSSELLPKEQARERASRSAQSEVRFAATRQFDVPGYRALDWPELSFDLGSFYAPRREVTRYDYRITAAGDFAFMNGNASFSGNDNELTGATITLGRRNPRGMFGPLGIADFEIGDTSQFLPTLLGNSLSGRGLRLGNTLLADQRDIDTIDLQGEQQTDFEIELYVNNRLRAVDRNSSDGSYNFQDVRLQLGQNETRLEFYGPQGQRFTESRRTYVGSNQGRKGRFTYEFALIEPGKRVFDLVEQTDSTLPDEELPGLQLSSAVTMSYGLTRTTGISLTIASLAADKDTLADEHSKNHNYVNTKLTTDFAGTLLSTDVSMDPNGNIAAALAARGARGNYEFGLTQQIFAEDYRSIDDINDDEDEASQLTRHATTLNLSHQYFEVPVGRLSYGANTTYHVNHDNEKLASLGTQVDYQSPLLGVSWKHDYRRDLSQHSGHSRGQIGFSLRASERTPWSLGSTLEYTDTAQQLVNSGSLRLSRPIAANGQLSIIASRNLQNSSTGYSASLSRQFRNFRFDSTLAGTSVDDISLRLGVAFSAQRYPGQWMPTIASASGHASVAVVVFADENGNGIHDTEEQLIEDIRITRNGLLSGAATDKNGVALMTGLSVNTSVDIGVVEADITDPNLKFQGITNGILPRPGRVPVFPIPLQRATDLEGTVLISGSSPAPNVRMLLTPVDSSANAPMEIYTEFDGYYYLSGIPLGVYKFGPDPEQLRAAGLKAQPEVTTVVLENTDHFPEPENFTLVRITDTTNHEAGYTGTFVEIHAVSSDE